MSPEEDFVRGVWMTVPSEDDTAWIKRVAALPRTDQPLGDYGALVKRMLECGISEYEIARFAKIVGYETAFGITYLLEDPLAGAHELMLSMDPSGREMRPRRENE